MDKLPKDWITKGHLDFEYKKYILLAYLKNVHKHFNQQRLYPFLSDLMKNYHSLIGLKKQKEAVYENFPERIKKVDLEQLIIEYEKIIDEEEYMEEIASIIEFALPKIKKHLKEGHDLKAFVEENLHIAPVGLVSLYKEEGYILLRHGGAQKAIVFEYQVALYEKAKEKYRTIKMQYVSEYTKSINYTYEAIKKDLIRTYRRFANPATYVVETDLTFPLEATLLPVAKKKLARYLAG